MFGQATRTLQGKVAPIFFATTHSYHSLTVVKKGIFGPAIKLRMHVYTYIGYFLFPFRILRSN